MTGHMTGPMTGHTAYASAVLALLLSVGPAAGQPGVTTVKLQTATDYKYVVGLSQFNSDNLLCAGVLVAEDVVVTAAQCVANRRADFLRVVTERRNVSQAFSPEFQEYSVSEAVIHPCYDGHHSGHQSDRGNDVAVLKLDRPTRSLDGMPLPTVSLAQETPAPGSSLQVLGWGATKDNGATSDVKKVADVRFMAPETCAASYPSQLTDSMLCTRSLEAGKRACTGDAGGPLVADGNSDAPKLLGIYSWSKKCAFGNPSVYASIPSLGGWVQGVVSDLSQQYP